MVGGGFFLVSPVKDRKDLEGDLAAGVPSVFAVLARRGLSPERSERVVGGVASVTLFTGVVLLAWLGRGHLVWLGLAAVATVGVTLGMVRSKSPLHSTLFSLGSVNLFLLLTLISLGLESDVEAQSLHEPQSLSQAEVFVEDANSHWTEVQLGCFKEQNQASIYLGMKKVGEEWYVLVSRGIPVWVEADNPCVQMGSNAG
jgi:hypothetical protein